MEETNKVYRIRTNVGDDSPNVIHVPMNQTYEMFEILSLKIEQKNTYKTYESDYGVVVGRVIANGGVGVPNAKISIFIEVSDDDTLEQRWLYNFSSTSSTDNSGVRYNLLSDEVDDECHQDVGTFPNKRYVLDNKDVIETFEKYWKYTTTTNSSGDYMIFGIPTGSQTLHCDIDLSDCGVLSQRPRDMVYKGYNAEMFESPNKFKTSKNLNSLAQIITQDKGIYVYPYWGDISQGSNDFSITRCDISIEYKFEPTAVFIGSIVTDKGSNAIGKDCTANEISGKMSDLIAGEGTIEMIRKTVDNKVEEFPINGNRLIDGDGVWCYQIPMNLDYVKTDEFGNLVPSDDPNKGIATRARVRFRITLDENPSDVAARKRARYLVPNNPRMGEESFDEELDADYEFGTATKDESYCDLFWNKVYTVKNYIPKLQKNKKETNRKHTGIKLINHYGDNNPMPYNSLTIKLGFTYRIICSLTKVFINLVEFVNQIISLVGAILCLILLVIDIPMLLLDGVYNLLTIKLPLGIGRVHLLPTAVVRAIKSAYNALTYPFRYVIGLFMPNCIGLSSEFCDDGINKTKYYPGCAKFFFNLFDYGDINILGHSFDCIWSGDGGTEKNHYKRQLEDCKKDKLSAEECEATLTEASNATAQLYNCIENQLAQQNDATSFNFNNDWVNGVLYAPLWYRKIKPKRRYLFGLIKRKAKDDWCTANRNYVGLRIIQQCVLKRESPDKINNLDNENVDFKYVNVKNVCGSKCHQNAQEVKGMNGVIVPQQTMLGQTVYYYKSVEHDSSLPKNYFYDKNGNKHEINDKKKGEVKLLFATDIVLLGSLNECDKHGIPQFFKSLESTTYNMPSDLLFTDYDFIMTVNSKTGEAERMEYTVDGLVKTSEMAGCDWGNPNEFGKYDGGLFYSIACTSGSIKLDTASCINLSRVCEYGVSLDQTKEVEDLPKLKDVEENKDIDNEIDNTDEYSQKLVTDGFISWDELYNLDERSMFATMNGNNLKTKLGNTGLLEYDFRYLYPDNFDGSLKEVMKNKTEKYSSEINYKNNWKLEDKSRDYYLFRMGNYPYFYDGGDVGIYSFPRYENSFYFYFGLKSGKTAIEKFNSKYFATCSNHDDISEQIGIKYKANGWCSQNEDDYDGYVAFDFSSIMTPFSLLINSVSGNYSLQINDITEDKVILINNIEDIPSKLQDEYIPLKGKKFEPHVYEYSNDKEVIPMIPNGSYEASITDGNGNIIEFNFKIVGKYLTYKANTQSFEQPNNVLMQIFNNDLSKVASDYEGLDYTDTQNVIRDIGGVITVYDILMEGEVLDFYKIEIRPNEEMEGYGGVELIYNNGSIKINGQEVENEEHQDSVIYFDYDHHYAFGLPKGKFEYNITVTQLCDKAYDAANSVSRNVFVDGPKPFKMYINDVDYDVIKNFDNNTGWTLKNYISNRAEEVINNNTVLNMSNPWFSKIDNIFSTDLVVVEGENNERINLTNEIVEFIVKRTNDQRNFKLLDKTVNITDSTYGDLTDEQKKIYKSYYRYKKGNIISNSEYDTLTDKQKELYEQVYQNTNDESIITVDEYNDLTEGQENYEIVHKFKLDDIIDEDVYNTLETDQKSLYDLLYYFIKDDIISVDDYNSLANNDEKSFYVKMYQKIDDEEIFITPSAYNALPAEQHLDYREIYKLKENTKKTLTKTEYNALNTNKRNLYGSYKLIFDKNILDEDEYFSLTNNQRLLFKEEYTIYAVTANDEEYEVDEGALIGEYMGEPDSDKVAYIWVDDYIVEEYDDIDDFIEKVNSVLEYRKDLPRKMRNAFFLYCLDGGLDISVTYSTNKLPCTTTIVYHPEKAVEFEDYNILDGANTKVTNDSTIYDVKIPTITYGSSVNFGDGTDSDAPCLSKVNNIQKKPYSAGIMNSSGMSIPKDGNNGPFDSVSDDYGKLIDESLTKYNDLFSFPIIDKILSVEYIAWSSFVNIPFYKKENSNQEYVIESVTMNGLLSSVIVNGNVTNDRFYTQKLNDFDLKLSNNVCDATQTYIEKRVVNGYNYELLGNRCLEILKKYADIDIDREIVEVFNGIFNVVIIDPNNINTQTKEFFRNVLSNMTFSGDEFIITISNVEYKTNINNILSYVLSFTNYIVYDNAQGNMQYAFVLPLQTMFTLQDEGGCGIMETIDGGMTVELSDEAVNDCRSGGNKIVKFTAEDNGVYFSIFNAETNPYPLNLAESNGVLWQISEQVNGIYSQSNPQNLFSFQMKSEYLRGKNNIIDTKFKSEILVSSEGEEEVYEDSEGYGTTGNFEFRGTISEKFDYPIFVVAETDNHVRALSPVYDYSDVSASVGYGTLKRIDVTEIYNETTEQTTYRVESETSEYKFGVKVKKGHYYIDNYPYSLSCVCTLDSSNTIRIEEETLYSSNQYIFTSISADLYNTIRNKFNNGIIGQLFNDIARNTEITAIDYTSLKHICGIKKSDFKDMIWHTFIWRGNLPLNDDERPGINTCGIFVNNEYVDSTEIIYEENETDIASPVMYVSNNFRSNFVGWSENKPDLNHLIQDFNTYTPVSSSHVFYGNWTEAAVFYTVIFMDNDGVTELHRESVENGNSVEKYGNYNYYLLDDITKTEISFPYIVNRNLTFVRYNYFTVNWIDTEGDDDVYYEPIEENTTGNTSLQLKFSGIDSGKSSENGPGNLYFSGNIRNNNMLYSVGCGCMYSWFDRNNTGGINVSGNNKYYSLIDDYGMFFINPLGFGSWRGALSNTTYQENITVYPTNDTTLETTIQMYGTIDENNSLFLYGDIINKGMRIPNSGCDGMITLTQYPYTFYSTYFFEKPKITYITGTEDGQFVVSNIMSDSFSVNGFNCRLESTESDLIYNFYYDVDTNNTSDYKYHFICFSTDYITLDKLYDGNCVILNFIQEYNVKNRIYYGNGMYAIKDYDDNYRETHSNDYKYHSWFETCTSEILKNDNITINISYQNKMMAYPNSVYFDYNINGTYEVLDNNYIWGDKSYTVVNVTGNNITFIKK